MFIRKVIWVKAEVLWRQSQIYWIRKKYHFLPHQKKNQKSNSNVYSVLSENIKDFISCIISTELLNIPFPLFVPLLFFPPTPLHTAHTHLYSESPQVFSQSSGRTALFPWLLLQPLASSLHPLSCLSWLVVFLLPYPVTSGSIGQSQAEDTWTTKLSSWKVGGAFSGVVQWLRFWADRDPAWCN